MREFYLRLKDSFVEIYMSSRGTNLCQKFRALKKFNWICSLRGIISVLTQDVLLEETHAGMHMSSLMCMVEPILFTGGPLLLCLLSALRQRLSSFVGVSLCFHELCALSQTLDRYKEILSAMKESLSPNMHSEV